MAAKIHPTAIVDPGAVLGEGVSVGPGAIIEGDVKIGDGCEIMAGAVIRRYTEMGPGNVVHPHAVLGGLPQDLKCDPSVKTYLRIGANNVFREFTSFSRATRPGGATVLGSGCYFMACTHAGHDAVVGDGVILTNGAVIAGHAEIGDGVVLSAYVTVHQFCWIGERVMMQAHTGISQHAPPFLMCRFNNCVWGLNVVGLRRAPGITPEDIAQIKECYRLLYRSSLPLAGALAEMDAHADWGAPAGRFRDFIRRVLAARPPYDRGLPADRAARGLGQDGRTRER